MRSLVRANRAKALLFLALVATGLSSVQNDRWWPQWALLMPILLGLMVLDRIYFRSKVLGISLMYFGINACFTGYWRMNQFMGWALVDRLVFQTAALDFFASLSLFTFFFAYMGVSTRGILKYLFYVLLSLTWGQLMFSYHAYGFLGNYGMNTSLLAVLYPFAQGYLAAVLVSVAILMSGASTPLLVWGVVLFSLYRFGGKRVLLITGLVGAGTLLLLLKYPEYLNDSSRFKNWTFYLRYFWQHNIWFGNGAASFKALGPYIQGMHGEKVEWLYWAHNEYLEVLFDFGILGLVALLSSLFVLVRLTYRLAYKGKHRAALLGAMACGLTDYPLRLAMFMFVIVLIVRELVYGES